MEISRPSNDEIEVSVFGGGKGFGECILLHLKNDFWAVVDSFNITSNKEQIPVAQHYLQTLYPDSWQTKIKLVIISHWHDDHIRGVSTLIKNSQAIENVVISGALTYKNLRELIKAEHVDNRTDIISTNEIVETYTWGHKNKDKLCYSSEFLMLPFLNEKVKFQFLSPSTEIINTINQNLISEITELLVKNKIKKIVAPSQNIASSALLIHLKDEQPILLGADLESNYTKYPNSGWNRVVEILREKYEPSQSFLFKVSHHGSSNGHCDEIWSELLHEKPIAVLTPYLRGELANQLPKKEWVEKFSNKTSKAFITAKPNWSTSQKLKNNYGHVRTRKKGNEVKVDLLNGAVRLEELINKTATV